MKNKQQVLRFVIVGSTNTVIDFGLLLLLTALGVNKIIANTISTLCAFVFSFVANKKFTFKNNSKNTKKQFILFIAVTLFGLWVIQNVLIAAIHPSIITVLQVSEPTALMVSKLAASVVTLVWNYIMYNKVVFKSKE